MNALFRKPSIGNREMARIQKEISPLDHGAQYLSSELPRRFVASTNRQARGGSGVPPAMAAAQGLHVASAVRSTLRWDTRLFNYLPGGSFQSSRPRHYGRRLRRNRAVALTLFAGLWVYWIAARFC